MLSLIRMPMHSKMNYFNLKMHRALKANAEDNETHDELTAPANTNISKIFTTNGRR